MGEKRIAEMLGVKRTFVRQFLKELKEKQPWTNLLNGLLWKTELKTN
jgi:hypothetical protein